MENNLSRSQKLKSKKKSQQNDQSFQTESTKFFFNNENNKDKYNYPITKNFKFIQTNEQLTKCAHNLNLNRNRRFYFKHRFINYNNDRFQYNHQRYCKQFTKFGFYKDNLKKIGNYQNFGFHKFNNKSFDINVKTTYSDIKKYDFSVLPNIVLAKIYSYLNLKDRLNASLSCKNWRISLFNPCLWYEYDLNIYLCDKQSDLKSAHFKLQNLSKFIKACVIKFDSNDYNLIDQLAKSLDFLKGQGNNGNFTNLKFLTLQPIFNFFIDEDESIEYRNENVPIINRIFNQNIVQLKKRIYTTISEIIINSKCMEHVALGFLNNSGKTYEKISKLISNLSNKHSSNLKSLHISSINNASSLYLKNHNSINTSISFQTELLFAFSNLKVLSINYEVLTDELIQSNLFKISLKKLNLNVNHDFAMSESDNQKRTTSWLIATNENPNLRVSINFLKFEKSLQRFLFILNTKIPLEKLRMYFCKSFQPELIQFLSNHYSDTLKCLCVVDAIKEPILRYHNPLSMNADPDPLVLLCWKCKYLEELIVVGYEILEINLIAIAKLRNKLKLFYVAMDCVIDLKYGQFRNNDFIEDEDGEDTIVDYGFCSDQAINKVCKILGSQNWHPLEKDELPFCVYDTSIPFEEAYLDTLIKDQQYNAY